MKASASITITSYTDGLTTFYQYAKNTSNASPPTTGWSATMPSSEPNKFIWRREATALSLDDVTAWVNTMCLTGSTGAKGDKGDTGSVGQGVESIIEEYYLSTSKTARTGGSWVTDPPTWSTGKYIWTRSKITYKNPTDIKYTTPVCDSSWEAVNLTEDELKKYIQSRGENLITNGSGLLGSNYNFSAFTYDGSEAYYSNGSFRYYGSGTKFTDEFMPVNPELAYKLSMFAKTANGVGRYYAMVACFDVDNQEILAQHHMYRANTLTTLSQELKNGDTVVHLTDASNWYNGGTAGVSTYLRSIILWNYKNSYGYLYPPQTYSRNWIRNAWNPGAINFENNTITLISPWAGGTVEAGTPLSNGSDGLTYKYCAMSNTIIPTTWTEYAGVISDIDLSGSNVSGKFPPGTAKVKIGWLLNYQGSGETVWITNLAFNIHLATQSELDSTKLIVDLSVKSSDVEYYLSTSSTSLSGGSWQTTAPTWVDGKYMWSRTRVELNNGTVRYTPSASGTCIAGAKGATGERGPQGLQGIQGPKGDKGIQGPKGADGLDSYTHIAYATGASGQNFSVSHFPSATYIGMYVDHTEADSTTWSDYKWTLIKGADGAQGIPGVKGDDGLTAYFHTAWANNSTGTSGFSTTVSAGKLYIGTYTDHTEADSSDPTKYKWVKIKGETGASDQLIVQYALGTWDAPPSTVIIGEESWGLGHDDWIAGQNFWKSTAPYTGNPDDHIWMRTRTYRGSTGTFTEWSYSRISGPAGTPGFLGLYAEGETLHLKGYGADGVLDQSVGYIYAGGERIAVPATSLTLTEEGTGYILFNNTWIDKVVFAKMKPQPDSVDWIAYNDPSATAYSTTNTYVIGKFQKDNTVIHDEVIISPVGCKDYTTAHFMEIIATEDWASFQVWAEALNVTQTFERLAAFEMFTNKLNANNVTVGFGRTTGFRFRAMSDRDMDGGNIPVFDVMYDDRKVFEVDSKNGNVIFGDYETGNGLRWENSTNLLSVRGSGKFTGTIDHDALTTMDAVASQISVNFATKSAYYGQSLYDALVSIGSGGWVSSSGSFGGISFSQIALLGTTEQKAIIVDSSARYGVPLEFVSKYTGSVRFVFEARPSVLWSATVNLYINGVLISSTYRPAFSGVTVVTVDRNVAEGDVIRLTTSGNEIYFKMYIRGIGIALNMGSRYVSIKTNSYYNNRFILSSPKSVDSNSYLNYNSAEAIIGALAALTPNRSYPTTSGSSISVSGGGAKSVTSIMRSSESVVIETTSGTVYLATASQEGVSGYTLSGAITINTSEASLRTLTVLPKQDNTHSLGSRSLNLYYSDLFVSSLVGMISAFASSAAPSGWLECNGQAVSRSTYSKLYSAIGTTFGAGNGSTTFNVPDLRGEFIRGWSHGRSGIDEGRTIGSFQDQSIQSHAHSYKFSDPYSSAGQSSGTSASKIWEEDRTTGYTGGAETRPRNVALMYCIKY